MNSIIPLRKKDILKACYENGTLAFQGNTKVLEIFLKEMFVGISSRTGGMARAVY